MGQAPVVVVVDDVADGHGSVAPSALSTESFVDFDNFDNCLCQLPC